MPPAPTARLASAALVASLGLAALGVACSGGGSDGSQAADGEKHGPFTDVGKPCSASGECQSGDCAPLVGVPLGGVRRGVCTLPCAGDLDCLAGWSCTPVPGGPSVCQCAPASETCNGKDDDCNGVIDDPGPAAASCDAAGEAVCTRGACACTAPGRVWGATPEVALPCGCPAGTTACTDQGGLTRCVDLTSDSANCGACGASCVGNGAIQQPGSTCAASACRCGTPPTPTSAVCAPSASNLCGIDDARCHSLDVVYSAGYDRVPALALASGAALFVQLVCSPYSGCSSSLLSAPTTPTTPPATAVAIASPAAPYYGTERFGVASDGTDGAYATLFTGAQYGTDSIYACPKGSCAGGGALLAASRAEKMLSVAGGNVTWIDGAGKLQRCALTGCAGAPSVVTTLAGVVAATADATGAFVAYAGGDVGVVPLGGGAPFLLASGQSVLSMAFDATTLYWVTPTGLNACAKAGCGGAPTALTKTAINGVPMGALAIDDTYVYWTEAGLFRCAKGGCAVPTKLTTALDGPIGLDASFVYGSAAHTLVRFSQ
jgi:hypothetical protein